MYLKCVEICGFKSFGKPTRIAFERGLTAIVGPNGCGKSNVVDAIRWALGEQSVRSLRGKAMADVIFNGGGSHGPMGMAEVTLQFDNTDGTLEGERDQVRVTRRLFRSGQSEYLLNGAKARLRDIRELLLDTGAGASAATFVEQGRIDALLHASPIERRAVLEEAAGIGKYKLRRQQALARLDEVAQHRVRLDDVCREVNERYRALKRQASKAEKFVAMRDELLTLQTLLFQHVAAETSSQAKRAQAEHEQHAALAKVQSAQTATLTASTTDLSESHATAQRHVHNEELDLRDVNVRLQAAEDNAEAILVHLAEQADDVRRDAHSLEALERKRARLADELAAGRDKVGAFQGSDVQLAAKLAACQQQLAKTDQDCKRLREDRERTKTELVAAMQDSARGRNRLAELQARGRVLSGREQRLVGKVDELSAKATQEQEQAEKLLATAADQLETVEALSTKATEAARHHDACDQKLRSIEERYLNTRHVLSELGAQHRALVALEEEGVGLPPGARALLSQDHSGVVGVLADLLGMEQAHADAVAVALGARAQWVVVDNDSSAITLLDALRNTDAGRCELASLTTMATATTLAPAPETAGFVGWAAELAAPETEVRPLIHALLAGVAIVVTRLDAETLLAFPGVSACVTLDGEYLGGNGLFVGGASPDDDRISRRSERTAIELDIAHRQSALTQLKEAMDDLRTQTRQAADTAACLRQDHHSAALDHASAKREASDCQRLSQRATEEHRLTAVELAEVREDQKRTHTELETYTAKAASSEDVSYHLEKSLAELERQSAQLEDERRGVQETCNQFKIELARGGEQWEALKRAALRAERELEETVGELTRAEEDAVRSNKRLNDATQRRDALQTEISTLRSDADQRSERLVADKRALATLAKDLESELTALATAKEALRKHELAATSAAQQAQTARDKLCDLDQRVEQELSTTLEALGPPPPHSPQTPPFNRREAEARCTSIRRSLGAMGDVNLEALRECDKLAVRKDELSAQVKDLARAEENLRSSIRRINDTCRQRFSATFDEVRGHFREIFRKLFGGGKADLILDVDVDVLEAGVEVVARPPGKQARSLSLLSGGEKVLTTAALLFAVFQTRPGPFCLLDEVDAALDEHNVGRFVNLVREFLDRSQIIVITHNKATMQAADVLYGITMPEAGVSAPVSVRVSEALDMVAA